MLRQQPEPVGLVSHRYWIKSFCLLLICAHEYTPTLVYLHARLSAVRRDHSVRIELSDFCSCQTVGGDLRLNVHVWSDVQERANGLWFLPSLQVDMDAPSTWWRSRGAHLSITPARFTILHCRQPIYPSRHEWLPQPEVAHLATQRRGTGPGLRYERHESLHTTPPEDYICMYIHAWLYLQTARLLCLSDK